jgi:quinoprotein glucose dehydrogenase
VLDYNSLAKLPLSSAAGAREEDLKRVGLLGTIAFAPMLANAQADWPTYGHDSGGQRYSPLKQITPANASDLKVSWVYHMKPANAPDLMPVEGFPGGARPARPGTNPNPPASPMAQSPDAQNGNSPKGSQAPPTGTPQKSTPPDNATAQAQAEGVRPSRFASRYLASEVTPIVAGGLMYLSTPYSRVVALDPASGKEVWAYTTPAGSGVPSLRGVEYWPGDGAHGAEVLFGTREGLLVALDAKTGKPVSSFGKEGVLDMRTPEVMNGFPRGIGMTSPPIVYKNLVITGSAVPESPSQGPAGDVRAWDVLTGKLVWTFRSIPLPGEVGHDTWRGDDWKKRTGTNVWGFLTVDAARGIVYMPFGTPAYDRFGADRPGNGLFGTSLVAADAKTGKMLWYFQVVHHDEWDYDLEAPPLLLDVKKNGKTIPAVAIVSKSSYVFFLDRVTGKPVFPIEERPVPKSDVPGEEMSPTQPFPVVTPPVSRVNFSMADLATVTPELEKFCRALVQDNDLQMGPVFTPLPLQKTLISFPSAIGGVNWGGASFDPKQSLMFVNSQNLGQLEGLYPNPAGPLAYRMGGSVTGRFWDEPHRLPCQQPPWGELYAIDTNTGKLAWKVNLGVTDSLPEGLRNTGRPNIGGSIVTAGGVLFIGATDDARFRAFDSKTGKELWAYKLGAAAHSVPSTYEANGNQYVVIASAGGTFLSDPITDDSITAFAVQKPSR